MKNTPFNTLLSVFLLTGILSLILWIFWQQQAAYLLPIPKPQDYQEVALGVRPDIQIAQLAPGKQDKPKFLHFYDPDCPCPSFNVQHFRAMVQAFRDSVDFFVVLESDSETVREVAAEFSIPVIEDATGKIAKAYGVYATPQALILDNSGSIYYRGNYNQAGLCISRNTRFAEMALQAIVRQKPLPYQFEALTGISYGCILPLYAEKNSLSTLFQN